MLIHGIAYEAVFVFTDALDIHPYRPVAQHADNSLATMTQIEVDVGLADDGGFSMLAIFKQRTLGDAVFITQPLTQQQIGCCTSLAPQVILELQGLLASLLRQQGQSCIEVEVG